MSSVENYFFFVVLPLHPSIDFLSKFLFFWFFLERERKVLLFLFHIRKDGRHDEKNRSKEIKIISYGSDTTGFLEVSVLKMVYCYNNLCCYLHCGLNQPSPHTECVLLRKRGRRSQDR